MVPQRLWAQGPHCSRIPGETDCVVRGSEETMKTGGGVSWPDEEVISKTWSVSLPNLPEAASSLQTIEGRFPLLLGTHLYKKRQSTGIQENSELVLPNTHTPQDSGASLNGPRGPIKDHSLLSILKEQCQNSAEISKQDCLSSELVFLHVVQSPCRTIPTSKGMDLSHHSSQEPLKWQSQATLA